MPDLHTPEHRRQVGAMLAGARARIDAELRLHRQWADRSLAALATLDDYVAGEAPPELAVLVARGAALDGKPCPEHAGEQDFADGCDVCAAEYAYLTAIDDSANDAVTGAYVSILHAIGDPNAQEPRYEVAVCADEGAMPRYQDDALPEGMAAGAAYLAQHPIDAGVTP